MAVLDRTVAIYGRSLFAEGVGLVLHAHADLRVVWVDSTDPQALQQLATFRPDVLLLDLVHTGPDTMVALLLQPAAPSILALDLVRNQITCLAVHPTAAATVEDLLALVQVCAR